MSEMTRPNCADKTDEKLALETILSREAFGCLIERYQQKLARYIWRLGGISGQDGDDVLQNVFLKAYKNINEFDVNLKFSSWLYRIAHNEAISFLRAKKINYNATQEDGSELLEKIASDIDLPKEADISLAQKRVAQVLNAMDSRYREVLMLKYLENKDYSEISDILKVPMGTVATMISRAKKQFKDRAQKMEIKF